MDKLTIFSVSITSLLIIFLIYYTYNSYKNEKFTNKFNNTEKKGKLIFYHADWCGGCQQFKPEWEEIKRTYNNALDFVDYEYKQIPKEILETLYAFPTIYYDDYEQKKLVEINNIHDIKKLV